MSRRQEIELIDIAIRNRDIGEYAMKSFIGSRTFCKAAVLASFITAKSEDRLHMRMSLYYELADYVEEAICDQLRIDSHNLTESEVEQIRGKVYREIHQVAKWLRNKTHNYADRVQDIKEVRVAPDFARGILVVRFEPR
ncbi:hypothetical protein CF95_gp029 [Erwinia phage PhiEaH1]|jgi:hypothetical protein|uniref:Uncharacterized protein n=1 Tax=Erwinia phage PhiEaH1 TaxID=1401669 RepID=W8CZK8_9CAUD|nr:hypothetical protein CF95_gp029 [Erwinia phage PhiEaH1]AGX01751.1 hypothetical protein [Erwinia phage PhiEaH1]WBF04817.1 hypothetical protein [Erwinia phage vB_Ea277G]